MSSAPLAASIPQKSFGAVQVPTCDSPTQEVDVEQAALLGKLGAHTRPVTTIPKSISQKLKVLMLAGTIAVIYLHSYTGHPPDFRGGSGSDPRPWKFSFVFQLDFLANGLLKFAVPMFFTVSGFLFFVHRAEDFPQFQFRRRITARVTSLGLPYLLWTLQTLVVIYAFLHTKWGLEVFSDHSLLAPTTGDWVEYFVGSVGIQLWYIRDLFILACLSPLWHGLFRLHKVALLAVPAAAMLLFVVEQKLLSWCFLSFCPDIHILQLEGVIFFPLGAYFALSGVDLERKLPKSQFLCLLVVWVGLLLFRTVVDLYMWEKTKGQRQLLGYLHQLNVPLGVAVVWFAYDLVEPVLRFREVLWTWILWFSNYSMWMYCAHQPLLQISLTAILQGLAPLNASQWVYLAVFFIYPLLLMGLLLAIGVPLSCHCASVFGLLTGGRGS